MSTALAHNDPLDACPTDGAGFSGAVIHSKMILILTAAIDPIEGRAVATDAFLQDFTDRFMQRLRLFHRDRIGGSQRMQFCQMQGLIGINIAKAGKKGLVQQ